VSRAIVEARDLVVSFDGTTALDRLRRPAAVGRAPVNWRMPATRVAEIMGVVEEGA
jgi:hypothetical protein